MSSSEHESQQSTLTQLVQPPKSRQAKGIHSLIWEQLEESDRSPEGFPGIRLAYLDGTLEIMPISAEHEDFKSTISRLLETYLDEAKVLGEVTMISLMPYQPVFQELLHFPGSAVRSKHSHPGLESQQVSTFASTGGDRMT